MIIKKTVAVFHNRRTGAEKREIIEYVVTENPPHGAVKKVYFSTDGHWALQFFIDQDTIKRSNIRERMKCILGSYNFCLSEEDGGRNGNTRENAAYYREFFSWPSAITDDPEQGFGIICPVFPKRFRYGDNAFIFPAQNKRNTGTPRDCQWYRTQNNKRCLRESEQGDLHKILSICFLIAKMTDSLHNAGLAHSDLSCRNILLDIQRGDCLITDVDGLVVPGIYMPEVDGTRWYIAPEILKTRTLQGKDRKLPCIDTDRHALAVLIYELLLLRHPLLDGRKIIAPDNGAENEEFLKLGSQALFIENPKDTSNYIDEEKDSGITIKDFGHDLEELFIRSFISGLHNPAKRPTAGIWADSLSRTLDMLYPCSNINCPSGWFVLHDISNPVCPFCKNRISQDRIMRIRIHYPVLNRKGHWQFRGNVISLYDGAKLRRRHFFRECSLSESDEICAEIITKGNDLILKTHNMNGIILLNGTLIPENGSIKLQGDMWIRSGHDKNALLLKTEEIKI